MMPGLLPGVGHAATVRMDVVGAFRRARAAVGPLFRVQIGLQSRNLFCVGKNSFDLLEHPSVVDAGALLPDPAPAGRRRGALRLVETETPRCKVPAGTCVLFTGHISTRSRHLE